MIVVTGATRWGLLTRTWLELRLHGVLIACILRKLLLLRLRYGRSLLQLDPEEGAVGHMVAQHHPAMLIVIDPELGPVIDSKSGPDSVEDVLVGRPLVPGDFARGLGQPLHR